MNTIAKLLDEKAKERGVKRISRSQAAKEIGIHRVTFGKLIDQQVNQYDIETLVKLCNYFQCEPGDLLKLVELRERVQDKTDSSK